jgi:hypothetical protein
VSDRRITLDDSAGIVPAADNAMIKELPVHRRWRALFAGNSAYAVPIVNRVREQLNLSAESPTTEDVMRAFRVAFQTERREHVSDEILSPYNLTFTELKQVGAHLGEYFGTLMQDIKNFKLGIRFLVCGFEAEFFSRMFVVSDPGRIQSLDQMDYWAIGEGDYLALSTLTARPIASLRIPEVVYRCCEAKFVADSTLGSVGPDTTVHVMNSKGEDTLIQTRDVKIMRERWKASRKESSPIEIITLLKQRLGNRFDGS